MSGQCDIMDAASITAEPPVKPVREWAVKAGHFPETLPGTRLRPVRFNRKRWIPLAVCARLGLTLDSLIDERTYSDAVAAVLAVGAR
jgi:hypothetical protein